MEKDGQWYRTQSKFLKEVAVLKGYKYRRSSYEGYGKVIPFTLTKEERDKYKVVLRLTR